MEQFKFRITDNLEGLVVEKKDYSRYETSFRRWLVSEIDAKRMSILEAQTRFKLPVNFKVNFRHWQKTYSEKFHLSLRTMTSEELAKQKELEDQIKELEKQLQAAQITNVGLNIMIDIAEKDLKIPIRKKSNTKQ